MRILALIGALAIIVAIGAAIFFFGGFYSVAGTAEDPAVVTWALTQVRNASINRHALTSRRPPQPQRSRQVQAGAKAFAAHGCANCHGGPGVGWAKFSEGLHPDPPDLKEVVGHPLAGAIVLGGQERHQHDRHAELRAGRRQGRRNLDDRRVPEKTADVSEADYKAWTAATMRRRSHERRRSCRVSMATTTAGNAGKHRPIAVAEIRGDADERRSSAHRQRPSRRRRARTRLPGSRAAARQKPHDQNADQQPRTGAEQRRRLQRYRAADTSAAKAGRSGKTFSGRSRHRQATS